MVFHWSTPQRRIGHAHLEPIPVEIYHEIFTYIEPSPDSSEADCRATFSSIAGVCRFFAAEALPHVFHSFHVACHSPGSRNAMKLCREIKNDKPLASHIATLIKECVFSGWVFDEENQTEEAALAALLSLVRKAIQKMPELESIKLENCSVSNAVVKLVCQAPGLRSLHLYQCRLTSLVDDKIWDKLTSTRIDHLTLIDLQDEANEIESGSLISHIPLQHLVSLRTNYCAVLDNLTGPTNHLQRLEITEYRYSMDGLVALADAIGRLSLLTHLSIHRLTKVTLALNDSPGPSMPTHFTVIFLPSLRSLLCPGSIAAAILSPAPNSLMHLDLTGKHVIESTFSNVHTPWCFPTLDNVHVDGLEELVLPTHGMIKGAFPFNHPHPLLRKLTIIREDLGKQSFALSCIVILQAVCTVSQTANIPPLVEISFISGSELRWLLDLPSQRNEIQCLSPLFPTLREVQLEECVCWALVEGSWEPTILQPKTLRHLMAEFPEECKDYGRCIARYC
ncbi:hypothetical protein CPB85DRAFT_1432776 [Mucidula mucida]|nr:hypothetical protein CPB85DRAFT_1432776 [Mucidula mucida]